MQCRARAVNISLRAISVYRIAVFTLENILRAEDVSYSSSSRFQRENVRVVSCTRFFEVHLRGHWNALRFFPAQIRVAISKFTLDTSLFEDTCPAISNVPPLRVSARIQRSKPMRPLGSRARPLQFVALRSDYRGIFNGLEISLIPDTGVTNIREERRIKFSAVNETRAISSDEVTRESERSIEITRRNIQNPLGSILCDEARVLAAANRAARSETSAINFPISLGSNSLIRRRLIFAWHRG